MATRLEPTDLDLDQDGWESRQVSIYSEVSRQSDVELLADQECFSRQCSSIDEVASGAVDASLLEKAVAAAVAECRFCVSVGDPMQDDCPLIAVSDEFEAMTGYRRDEIIGKNCRVLNKNCSLDHEDFSALRASCRGGDRFTKVVLNRRKSGELFLNLIARLNLIDLCGLVVAQDLATGVDLWFLVGIQADVTHMAVDEIPEDHLNSLREVASTIRAKITEELSTFALSGALRARDRDSWWVAREPQYRPASENTLASLPPCRTWLEGADEVEQSRVVSRQASSLSRQATIMSDMHFGAEDFSMDAFMRQQSAVVDQQGVALVDDANIERAIVAAVKDCRFCVSIGDPRSEDCPLIAVSDEFEAMTGYSREEILGRNCRILNRDCQLGDCDLRGLRRACETGAPFTKVLLNRRKSGDLFLNLLDLRGLTVARKPGGQDLWFLVGIQADVTRHSMSCLEGTVADLHKVATSIREQLKDRLSEIAVAGSISRHAGTPGLWHPVIKARWKPGEQLADPPSLAWMARMSRNSLPRVGPRARGVAQHPGSAEPPRSRLEGAPLLPLVVGGAALVLLAGERQKFQAVEQLQGRRAGCLPALTTSLCAQRQSATVLERGFAVIRVICGRGSALTSSRHSPGGETNPRVDAAVDAGAMEAVVQGLWAHPAHEGVQAEGCGALQSLTVGEPSRKDRAADAGALEVLVAALRRHLGCAAVQERAPAAVRNLCVGTDLAGGTRARRATEAGALEALVDALKANASNPVVQEKASAALRNICAAASSAAPAERAAEAGALEALAACLRRHVAEVQVVDQACSAIQSICSGRGHDGGDTRLARAAEAGVIEAIVVALRAHAGNRALQGRALAALRDTCAGGDP
ncbi:unnamed protein product, partial [Prorocentrum cordatum]